MATEIKQRRNLEGLSAEQIAAALKAGELAVFAAEKAGLELKDSQLTRADLASMKPEAINQARLDGRLDDLLKGTK
jgi:hypothetical protein